MQFGYVRTSLAEPEPQLQIDALIAAGVDLNNIYLEKTSGLQTTRPILKKLLCTIKEKDLLIVMSLDSLARSLRELVDIINRLKEKGASFRSLEEGWDSMSSKGVGFFHFFEVLKRFKEQISKEKRLTGMEAAREAGRGGGRPRSLTNEQVELARELVEEKKMSIVEVAEQMKTSRWTISRALERIN